MLRLVGLSVAVAFALAVPLVASAGPVDDVHTSEHARGAEHAGEAAGRGSGTHEHEGGADERAGGADGASSGLGDPKAGAADERDAGDAGVVEDTADSRMLLDLGIATAARCGPELTSPDGIEAQTCVLTRGEETWARTYYRNATGRELSSVLSVMAPGGRTVRVHCAVGAEDEPGACETPRERMRGERGAYSAVAEFAAPDGRGPLLLRSGSNSALP
ncbi:hypothetical protein Sipo8835_30595 [Streptomyces ipomoeae]|uniref:Uncharacterized protein n=1 Tax=Streptomyces ipomoeae TaxID=103232 RepID=A0AAE8VXR6_9ACTN|nr:hypothetical protein Sipo7851_36260 [Streptomyces ipomoeae]TQE26000.1 hypothetical protein Sipo8835_30595 [Streptomyces ipomoeae]